MQKKINHNSPIYLLSDLLLAAFAVSIVAGTYIGLSNLTPRLSVTERTASVLGANTASEKVKFIPSDEKLAFITKNTATLSPSTPNSITLDIQFGALEQTTYDFTAITVKNESLQYKTIQVTPQFSLPNSLTTISLNHAGMTSVLVDSTGEIFPLDLSVPPNTVLSFRLIVQPTAAIATPTTLRVVFTERQ